MMKQLTAWQRTITSPGDAVAWVITTALALLFIAENSHRVEQLDDSFISYRYALNLVAGHGLVFNPGEYVEGFTNLLWTLLIALLVWLGAAAPSASQALSMLFGGLSLYSLHFYVRRFLPRRFAWLAAAAPAVMLASNSFACWMSTGLETPLFLFVTIVGLIAFDMQRPIVTAAICVLALLCRPEGGIMAAILVGVPWFTALMRGVGSQRDLIKISIPPMIFAASTIVLTFWRIAYYGDFVPNTFHAKVGQVPIALGWIYLKKFLADGNLLLLPGAILGGLAIPRLTIPLLFVLATIAYSIAIGGDVFPYGRFLLPVLPVLLAGACAAPAWLMGRQKVAGVAVMLALPVSAFVSLYGHVSVPGLVLANDFDMASLPSARFPRSAKRAMAEQHWMAGPDEERLVHALATKMRRARPGTSVVASISIGKLGYYNMDFCILDMVGLTDRHVGESRRSVPGAWIIPGHSRTDSDYILSRRPDIISIPDKAALHTLTTPAVADMLSNPGLEQNYRYDDKDGFWVRK
jgi:arabinofuranosyltransferase